MPNGRQLFTFLISLYIRFHCQSVVEPRFVTDLMVCRFYFIALSTLLFSIEESFKIFLPSFFFPPLASRLFSFLSLSLSLAHKHFLVFFHRLRSTYTSTVGLHTCIQFVLDCPFFHHHHQHLFPFLFLLPFLSILAIFRPHQDLNISAEPFIRCNFRSNRSH